MTTFKAAEQALGIDPTSTPAAESNDGGRNIAVRVQSYDLEKRTTTGVDLASGETVTIALRELAKPNAARTDVEDWSKARFREKKGIRELANPKAVVAGDDNGGTIIFEGVMRDKDGALTARWGSVAAHTADEAEVFVALVRPATAWGKNTTIDDKRSIEVVRPIAARPVKSTDELYQAMAETLARPFCNAVVRARDPEGELRTANIWKGKDNTPAEAVERFRKGDRRLGMLLSDDVCAAMAVETFALERFYPGRDYKQTLSDSAKLEAKRFLRDWSLGENKGYGFGEAIVALRQHDEGGMYFTMLRPTVNKMMLWPSLEALPTPNIQPSATPVKSDGIDAAVAADMESGLAKMAGDSRPTAEQAAMADKVAAAASSMRP